MESVNQTKEPNWSIIKDGAWSMTWEEVESHCEYLWNNIRRIYAEPKDIKTIVAVAKGGMIPASLIWQRIPHATMVILRVETYDEFLGQRPSKITNPEVLVHQCPDEASTLIIDDICDSGGTFRLIAQNFENATFGCMLARAEPKDQFEYDFCGGTVSNGIWVDFPWERRSENKPAEMPF